MKRLLVVLIISCLLVGCQSGGQNQSHGSVNEIEVTDQFLNHQLDFSFDVFKKLYTADNNTVVSPLSMQFAFAMLTNGAASTTLSQMESVFTDDVIDEYNVKMYSLMQKLLDDELSIANSIWVKDDFVVNQNFLDVVKDYYVANVYLEAFNQKTVNKMNDWVKEHTKDMIKHIVDEIDDSTVMYLMNAIAFEALWEKQYTANDVNEVPFVDYLGNEVMVDMMFSYENKYIELDDVTGFVKDYKGGNYSFVALLPQGDIVEFVQSLNGDKYKEIMSSVKEEKVSTGLPKFTFNYSVDLKDLFVDMGMKDAFDVNKADFSRIAEDLYITDALQKTYICVNETGTSAAAVTVIETGLGSAMMDSVYLDRPFVYMIVENETNLPVFVGSVMNFEE